jgi:hypothetical protein
MGNGLLNIAQTIFKTDLSATKIPNFKTQASKLKPQYPNSKPKNHTP